jgi:hypothetical protein
MASTSVGLWRVPINMPCGTSAFAGGLLVLGIVLAQISTLEEAGKSPDTGP